MHMKFLCPCVLPLVANSENQNTLPEAIFFVYKHLCCVFVVGDEIHVYTKFNSHSYYCL